MNSYAYPCSCYDCNMMNDNYRGQNKNIIECTESVTANDKNSKYVINQKTEMMQMKKMLMNVRIYS